MGAAQLQKEGEDPGRAVIRQAERETASGTQSGPSLSFSSNLPDNGKKKNFHVAVNAILFEVATEDIVVYPAHFTFSFFFTVKGEPSDSKRSSYVILKSIHFSTRFPSLHLKG